MFDDALAMALSFTGQDLAANQAGRLSGAQQAMLGSARAGMMRFTKRNNIFIAGFIVVVGGTLILVESQASGVGAQAALGVVASLAAVALIAGLAARQTRSRWNAMASGALSCAQGPAKTRMRSVAGEDGTSYRYEVTIGATKFRVAGEHVLMAFTDGRNYSAYYVGKGMTALLLSAEPI